MPEVNQYVLKHRELVELIIKASDVHDGTWYLMVNFGFTAGNFGPSKDDLAPGAAIVISQIGIQRANSGVVPEMTVDAAKVNPRK